MKSFEEIIKQNPVFLHNWSEKIDVIGDFKNIYATGKEYRMEEPPYGNEDYKNINILFASYGSDNHSGDAFVLFEENGVLYEVNGSHCSCCGLEGQWETEEVSLKELENRLINGSFGEDDYSGNEFKQDLCEFLGI